MTIYEIKDRLQDSPYFFSEQTMKFFGQKLENFKVSKIEENLYFLTCPMYSNRKKVGYTERNFCSLTNKFI